MSNQTEVFNKIKELIETLSEGLDQLSSFISEQKNDEGLEMIYDILAGVDSIIKAMGPHMEILPANKIKQVEANMIEQFNKLIDVFKENKATLLENLFIDENLLPAFREWKREMERVLMPFVAS